MGSTTITCAGRLLRQVDEKKRSPPSSQFQPFYGTYSVYRYLPTDTTYRFIPPCRYYSAAKLEKNVIAMIITFDLARRARQPLGPKQHRDGVSGFLSLHTRYPTVRKSPCRILRGGNSLCSPQTRRERGSGQPDRRCHGCYREIR